MISNKKVLLFGDSFADKNSVGEYVGWPGLLESYYKVTNFAVSGSSPDHQLKLMLDFIENTDSHSFKDTVVIFLISSPNRFVFNFYKNPSDHHLSIHLAYYESADLSYHDELSPYLKYKKFVEDFYKYYALNDEFQLTHVLKILGMLNLYSTLFDKVLVWPIFENLPYKLPTMSDKMTFVSTPLFNIEGNPYCNDDKRPNHLIKENHHIMVSQLIEWIETNRSIDLDQFKWTK